jgi:hypothetical protein
MRDGALHEDVVLSDATPDAVDILSAGGRE